MFYLDPDPGHAARLAYDAWTIKMPVEAAQMLCAALLGPYGLGASQREHPCARWVRASRRHADWLRSHALALCAEFQRRYGNVHASAGVLAMADTSSLPDAGWTDPPQAMRPACLRGPSTTAAYRRYAAWKRIQRPHRFTHWRSHDPRRPDFARTWRDLQRRNDPVRLAPPVQGETP